MLNHLRQHIAAVLAPARTATLASSGPAGLQVDLVPCMARDIQLYVWLPCTSDHLLNLEHSPCVVVTALGWQVRGRARVVDAATLPVGSARAPNALWSVLAEVRPTRVTVSQREGWGAAETIDVPEGELLE